MQTYKSAENFQAVTKISFRLGECPIWAMALIKTQKHIAPEQVFISSS
ncbi:hypothetical protein SAMN04488513_101669 [Pseudozobellia thermophila]|uniref:Uncharacterized protein n=1 Tax=Pseudozobellia thermophila TaxID=192903 RepID=A0A1M6C7J7_9FLAO|nr:hypothetical protein SAMN04488513_101669 [Pseudozobellia thermophila]